MATGKVVQMSFPKRKTIGFRQLQFFGDMAITKKTFNKVQSTKYVLGLVRLRLRHADQ